jgi:hypothetical protein
VSGSRHRAARWTRAVLLASLLAGCGSDPDFDRAARADTTVAWDEYLRVHPDGVHAEAARARLAALLEDRDWQRAHGSDTVDAYQRFVRAHPQGAHAHDALVAIANLNLVAPPRAETPAPPAPPVAVAVPPAPPGQAPASGAPTPPAAATAAVAATAYRVQLGAFGTSGGAERTWAGLAARYAELAGRAPLITAARTADGHDVYRLQVAGLERASAEALCAALAARRDPCAVVAPARERPRQRDPGRLTDQGRSESDASRQ